MVDLMLLMMFVSGLFVVCYLYNHLLMTLLGLEFLAMFLYLMLFIYLNFYFLSFYFLLIFLVFVVGEAALSLTILVSLIRCHGSDTVSSLSILSW